MRLSLLLLSSSLILSTACSEEPIPPVELVSFAVVGGNTNLRVGDTVMLSWEVKNAESVVITATPGGPIDGTSGNSGTVTSAALTEPTTFQLTATGADNSRVTSDPIRVEVRGIRITAFAADPAQIDLGQMTTLSWTISGDAPTEVIITDIDGDEVYNDVEASGTLELSPTKTQQYTLSVTAESGTDEETVDVTVTDSAPIIVSFTAAQNPVAFGDFAELRWETVGAFEVQVSKDGTPRRPWNTAGAARGSVSIEVDGASHEFKLEARTESGLISEEVITVMGLAVPAITQFDLLPLAYTQASTIATVTWDSTNADMVRLLVDGVAANGFPGTTSGTFDFMVTGAPPITLIAQNQVADDRQTQTITLGFDEPEPNDTSTTAIALAGDGIPVRGTIAPGDVDMYTVMVPQGARISAIVGYDQDTDTCSFDTLLQLYDNGNVLLEENDDFQGIQACSRIHPAVAGGADNLAAGVYYIAVSGGVPGAAGAGQYSLSVNVTGPETPIAGVQMTPIGTPLWTVEDVHQVSILAGNSNNMFPFLNDNIDGIFRPAHVLTGYDTVHPLFAPELPNDRDYSTLLSALFAVAEYRNTTTMTRAEFEPDQAVLVAMTLVPIAAAPIEDSYDFAAGPVLRTELFPMNVEYDASKDGADYFDGMPWQYPGYHQLMPPVPGSGTSHRIMSVVMTQEFGPMGVDAVGSYTHTFTVTDAGGNGWTVTIPLTVTE